MKRNEFLKYTTAGMITLPSLLKGFSLQAKVPVTSLSNSIATTETDHVLVIIKLEGGNDGLNTVIPLEFFGKYQSARPNVYIPQNKVLKLNGITKVGLHPAATGLQSLFNDGKLQIIQNVGYPDQSYSHFRSTDIWMTASDAAQVVNTGWLGRYLKYEYPNYPDGFPNAAMPDPLSIEIGYSMSLSLQGPLTGMGIAIPDVNGFYKLINDIYPPVPNTPAGEQLAYLRLIARQSRSYSDVIKAAATKVTTHSPSYPKEGTNNLADQLKIVSGLIASGLKTRVYMVSLGGFDTHDNQVEGSDHSVGQHANLIGTLSEAIKAFVDDLAYLGIQNRVVGMTMSEFGRRIISNGSQGTDHGAAAPMFIFGTPIQGGKILGDTPIIPDNPQGEDNLAMQYDFRSVYASMLKDWLCVPDADLQFSLLKNFQTLPILDSPSCMSVDSHEINQAAGKKLVSAYPNPFTESTTISFETFGGHTMLQIFNGSGQLLSVPVDSYYEAGKHSVRWNSGELPTGLYYCRLQNGVIQQVAQLLKVV